MLPLYAILLLYYYYLYYLLTLLKLYQVLLINNASPGKLFTGIIPYILLRGAIVIRTHHGPKNPYIYTYYYTPDQVLITTYHRFTTHLPLAIRNFKHRLRAYETDGCTRSTSQIVEVDRRPPPGCKYHRIALHRIMLCARSVSIKTCLVYTRTAAAVPYPDEYLVFQAVTAYEVGSIILYSTWWCCNIPTHIPGTPYQVLYYSSRTLVHQVLRT